MKKFILLSFLSITVFSCITTPNTKPLIGISYPDFYSSRWRVENELLKSKFKSAGIDVISAAANQDANLQNMQIRNMAAAGAQVIIIIPFDGKIIANTIDEITKLGTKVIAYDRLIQSAKLTAFVGFDNVEVGRNQVRGVLKIKNKGNFVLLNGSPDDYNAFLFHKGKMEVLQPYIDSGEIKIAGEEWIQNYEPSEAIKAMNKILRDNNNQIDAVISSSDGIALGAIYSMHLAGLAAPIPSSGILATDAGCNSIARGELSTTIFEDTRQLLPIVEDLTIRLIQHQNISGLKNVKLSELTNDVTLNGTVPCIFGIQSIVDNDNLKKLIVDSHFQPYEAVYKDVINPPPK